MRLRSAKTYHIAVDARHASNVLDVHTFRGANVNSDHFLVMAKIRSPKLKRDRVSSANTMRDALKIFLKSIMKKSRQLRSISTDSTTAKEVLNVNPQGRRSPWFDEECAEAICAKSS